MGHSLDKGDESFNKGGCSIDKNDFNSIYPWIGLNNIEIKFQS
jgi:hypothetical protein